MNQQYYVMHGQNVYGPVSAGQLKQWATDGHLSPDQQVSLDGKEWLAALTVPGLFPVAVPNALPPWTVPTVVASTPTISASQASPPAGIGQVESSQASTKGLNREWITSDTAKAPVEGAEILQNISPTHETAPASSVSSSSPPARQKETCEEWVNRQGFALHSLNSEGKSMMHLAVIERRIDCLQWLKDHGVDVNRRDRSGCTSLELTMDPRMRAMARMESLDLANLALLNEEELLQKQKSFNEECESYEEEEKRCEKIESVAEWLLANGADPVLADCPLHYKAAKTNQTWFLDLLANTNKINLKDELKTFALMDIAARSGSTTVLSWLLSGGAYAPPGNIWRYGPGDWTLVHAAAAYGQLETLKWMYEKQLNNLHLLLDGLPQEQQEQKIKLSIQYHFDEITTRHPTPIAYAQSRGHAEVVAWFKSIGISEAGLFSRLYYHWNRHGGIFGRLIGIGESKLAPPWEGFYSYILEANLKLEAYD